jgi:DNA-binding transcriptional MerR regulator
MSSKDVEDSLKKPIDKELTDMDSCIKDGVIVNAEACKKYLNTNKDKNEMAIIELGIRQHAQEGVLKTELDSSDVKVRDYLKEEGFSTDEISKMTKDTDSIAQVKEEILKRFQNQKKAIIEEMAKKIESKTSSNDGKIDNSDIGKL